MVGVPGGERLHMHWEEQVGRCLVWCGCNMSFMGSVKKTETERTGDRKVIKVIMGHAK